MLKTSSLSNEHRFVSIHALSPMLSKPVVPPFTSFSNTASQTVSRKTITEEEETMPAVVRPASVLSHKQSKSRNMRNEIYILSNYGCEGSLEINKIMKNLNTLKEEEKCLENYRQAQELNNQEQYISNLEKLTHIRKASKGRKVELMALKRELYYYEKLNRSQRHEIAKNSEIC